MMRVTKAICAGLSLSLGIVLQTQAQTETATAPPQLDGEALFTAKGCIGCHGANGNMPIMPSYPKVAGQNRGYIINQLNDYKSGSRNSGMAAVMTGMVAALTEEDVEKLADYLSSVSAGEQK